MICLAYLCFAPMFIWVGTKSAIVRGPFGLRLRKFIGSRDLEVVAKWGLLRAFTEVGALKVRLPDQRSIWLPFVFKPEQIANKIARHQEKFT